MTRQWAPGDVALYEYLNSGRLIALRVKGGNSRWGRRTCPIDEHGDADHWHLSNGGWTLGTSESIHRPLVVIDAADDVWLPNRLRIDAGELGGQTAISMRRIADEIEEQQRPPKPAEPTGAGAVVEDADGHTWVRTLRHDSPDWWYSDHGSSTPHWTAIHAVRVLSEGVA